MLSSLTLTVQRKKSNADIAADRVLTAGPINGPGGTAKVDAMDRMAKPKVRSNGPLKVSSRFNAVRTSAQIATK